jgi:hypothetical protein
MVDPERVPRRLSPKPRIRIQGARRQLAAWRQPRDGGWGHGRAVDLTSAEGDASAVWHWIDAHGAKYGLHRPIPGRTRSTQSRGDWHKLAVALRETRVRMAGDAPETATTKKVAKAGL